MNIKEKPLAPFHFQTPPKPKWEDYRIRGKFIKSEFQKDLDNWNQLYGPEPEPEWIRYDDRRPLDGAVCFWSRCPSTSSGGLSDHYLTQYFGQKIADYWLDKATFDTLHQNWLYHQVRYKGWEKSGDHAFIKENSQDDFVEVDFRDGYFTIQQYDNGDWGREIYCGEIPSTDLFEMICKENGIEL